MKLLKRGIDITTQYFRIFTIIGRFKGPKVLINTIPKSGTNLISNTLRYFPYLGRSLTKTIFIENGFDNFIYRKIENIKNGQYCVAHLPFNDKLNSILNKCNIKTIFMVRDPRDILVSYIKYVTEIDTKHKSHSYFKDLKNDDDRLLAAINGKTNIVEPIKNILTKYSQWLTQSNCLTIKYEDLIGEKGGGNRDIQKSTIKSIAAFLNIKITDLQIEKIAFKIYSRKSPTFRRGQISDWKNYFNSNHIKTIKESSSNIFSTYGYKLS